MKLLKGLAALFAVGLVIATGATGAAATPVFEAGKYPATVNGSTMVVIGTEGSTVTCPVDFDGTLSSASSTLELGTFFEYFNCNAWGFTNMTINNPCTQVFHATERQSADQYKEHYQLKCPQGGALILSAGTCAIEIPPQEGRTTVDVDDDTGPPKRITLAYEVSSLAYTVTKDGLGCALNGTGAKTGGTITSSAMELKAVNPSKTTEELGLAVSGE
jgi:hypothetical protein